MQTIRLHDPLAAFGEMLREGLRTARHAMWVWWRTVSTGRDIDDLDPRMLADLGISRAQADFDASRGAWNGLGR